MDLQYLKKLVRLLENSKVDEIEVEEEGIKIRIVKHSENRPSAGTIPQSVSVPVPQASVQSTSPVPPPTTQQVVSYHEIKAPIVGTFYRAPAPDADPYVEVGRVVQPGTVLCIIEAMKLMNEIESDISGRIVKIVVDNAQPVEYNQPLFYIEPV